MPEGQPGQPGQPGKDPACGPGWPANAAARLRLNSPEATAIVAHVLEGARDGRSAADLMKAGR